LWGCRSPWRAIVYTVSNGTVEIVFIFPAEKDAEMEIVNCLIVWGRSPWRAKGIGMKL
jgi:hypothetical protein